MNKEGFKQQIIRKALKTLNGSNPTDKEVDEISAVLTAAGIATSVAAILKFLTTTYDGGGNRVS